MLIIQFLNYFQDLFIIVSSFIFWSFHIRNSWESIVYIDFTHHFGDLISTTRKLIFNYNNFVIKDNTPVIKDSLGKSF